MTFIKQSVYLFLPFLAAYLWQISPASNYTLEVIALLIAIYLIISARKRFKNGTIFFGGTIDVLIFTLIILLIVLATGNYSSGVFFLLYFICFGISFVFEPIQVFVFVIYTAALFTALQYTQTDYITSNFLKLGSLFLIAPLSFFFGRELKQEEKEISELEAMDERNQDSANVISKNISEVIENEKSTIKSKDVEKLNEVLEESETLREKPDL